MSPVSRFSLRALRLRPGEEHRERLDVRFEPFVLGGERYAVAGGVVPATLTVQRAVTGDVHRLELAALVEGPCMRCLAPAAVPVEVDAREYEDADEGAGEGLRSEYVVDGDLDVGAWARDLVALSLPDQVLCRPDCAGLCPVCGRDLNLEPHAHEEASADPRWAALEALRPEGEER